MLRTPLIEKILNTVEINKILVEKLLDGYEKGQAEGESIHIADSTNLPMILRPQGQIIQDTRNGYNLLPLYKYIDVGFSQTINGVTITVLDNFSIKVTGKRISSNAPIDFYLFGQFTSTAEVLNLNGVYTFSISENPYAGIRGFLLHNSNICLDTNTNNKVISEELANITVSALLIRIETDNELNEIIYPMLYEGSEEKEYEEYGQMPSTNFPSPTKNVEGDYKIENVNSNLYDINDLSEKNINIQIDKDDWISGTIDNSGGSGYVFLNFFSRKKDYIKANKKYYVLLEVKKVSGTGRLSISSDFQGSSQFTSFGYDFSNLKSNSKYLSEITTINDFSKTIFALRSYLQFQSGESGSITFRLSLLNNKPDLEKFIYKKHDSKILELNIPKQIKLYNKNDGFIYLTEEQATELKVDGEGWYIVNNYKERDFSKEPLLTGKTAGPFAQGYYIIFDDIKGRASLDGNIIYSTHQKQKIPANPSMDAEWLKLDGNLIGQLYPSTHIGVYINYAPETKQEFVDWFNNLAPIIIYPIKKPVYTKITDKHFIKQLEDLQKVFSHEGTTNIDTYSSDDKEKAPLILSVEYLKSQKIINKNLDERITNLEVLLLEQ